MVKSSKASFRKAAAGALAVLSLATFLPDQLFLQAQQAQETVSMYMAR